MHRCVNMKTSKRLVLLRHYRLQRLTDIWTIEQETRILSNSNIYLNIHTHKKLIYFYIKYLKKVDKFKLSVRVLQKKLKINKNKTKRNCVWGIYTNLSNNNMNKLTFCNLFTRMCKWKLYCEMLVTVVTNLQRLMLTWASNE